MNLETLINDYIKMCSLQNNLDKKTIKAYKSDLNQFRNYVKNENIFYTKNIIVKYIFFLNNKKYAVKTVKRKIASLKAFFSYLNYEDIIETNPFHKIKLKLKEPLILPKTIPLANLQALFQYMYDEKNKYASNSTKYKTMLQNTIILEILLCTGIRISELCNIEQNNINVHKKYIKIYGKGAKERIIPIFNQNLWELINEYQILYKIKLEQNKYFFINRLGNKISDQSVRNMIKKFTKNAGIKLNITPHMFRHSFATMLLEQDVDIRNIQQILGHSSITTTQIYTHITSNKKSEIMRNKNPRDKIFVNKG